MTRLPLSAPLPAWLALALTACPSSETTAPPRAATGAAPNSVALTRCGDVDVALVAASSAARVDVIAVDDVGSVDVDRVAFEAGSTPWQAVPVPAQPGRALVTLYGAHAVALVDVCTGRELARVAPDAPFALAETLTLAFPIDVDGDGNDDATATQMLPRTPQAIAADTATTAWVTFTNIISPALPEQSMVAGPGVAARVVVDGDALTVERVVVLPCDNPQGVAADVDDVFVTCTGHFKNSGGALVRASSGGLVRLRAADGEVLAAVDVDESFGSPVLFAGEPPGRFAVGSVLGGGFYLFDENLTVVRDRTIAGKNESLFRALVLDGELAVTRFINGDVIKDPLGSALIVPFTDKNELPRGLIDVAVDVDAGRAYGVLSLSAELATVELP